MVKNIKSAINGVSYTWTKIVNMVSDSINSVGFSVLKEGLEPFSVKEPSRAQDFGSVVGIRINFFHYLSHESKILGVLISLKPCRNPTTRKLISCSFQTQNSVKLEGFPLQSKILGITQFIRVDLVAFRGSVSNEISSITWIPITNPCAFSIVGWLFTD